ncbi:hypothetical protein L6R53_06505 [Myxococcota bacterium]|nr:hypothetical protein [Myxococcota bacterium]
MIASSLLAALALASATPALAEDAPTRVFVSPFVARTRDATAIASLMPGFLQQQLDAHPELDAIAVGEVGPVYDTSAELYLSSCPAGEHIGCAFVVGEVARAELALVGTVDTVEGASRVEVVIIDVLESREVLSFQADLAVGDDMVFAEGVARVLVAVVRGEAGRSDDIRAEDDPQAAAAAAQRQAEIAAQLDQLSAEIGDVTTISTRTELEIERPRYTASDLAEKMEEEGVKPWERLDMGPREYLRYKNSDLSLAAWRQRAQGRSGQLLIRAGLGMGTGPTHGEYYGVYARSDQNLNVIEAYSYQAVTSGSGFGASGSVSYGLLPFLEVGLLAGTSTGRYGLLIDSYVVGDEHTLGEPEDRSNQVLFFGPQVLGTLLPTSIIRPVVGVEFTALLGTSISSRYDELPVPELSTFQAPLLFQAGGRVGAELRVADQLDLFLHLPVGMVIAGQASESSRVGSDGLDTQDILDPPGLSPISAGVQAGVQIRLGGRKADTGGVLDSDLL